MAEGAKNAARRARGASPSRSAGESERVEQRDHHGAGDGHPEWRSMTPVVPGNSATGVNTAPSTSVAATIARHFAHRAQE
jgi:hypothetical protein